jgi:hypothetical protein
MPAAGYKNKAICGAQGIGQRTVVYGHGAAAQLAQGGAVPFAHFGCAVAHRSGGGSAAQ